MQPFYRAQAVVPWQTAREVRRAFASFPGIDRFSDEEILMQLRALRSEVIYKNDVYQVNIRRIPAAEPGAPSLVHLSIKRIDRQPIHDWRDLQTIKNMLVGPECEGVELYPAESRRVDTANQYHLWVFAQPTVRFPFGFTEGVLAEDTGASGAMQRAFEP